MDGEVVSRVIRCTESNVADFRALLNGWPELKALVLDLQAQELFPGLRAMQVTLTGAPGWVTRGLAGLGSEGVAKGGAHAH